MAKVTGPLMSLDASGTVGKTATFSKWKGRNYVRLRVTPLNPQTDNQQDVRIKMGGVGYALSFVADPVAPDLGSLMYLAAVAKAPAGQSWISYLASQINGSAFSNFDSKHEAYALLSGTIQGYYAAAAAAAGIGNFTIAKTGTLDEIVMGELLYNLAWEAVTDLDYDGFSTDPDGASAEELATFVTYVTEQTGD